MIDTSHIKVHLHASGANEAQHKSTSAVGTHAIPVTILITGDSATNDSQAIELIKRIEADSLLADRAYDVNKIIEYCDKNGLELMIPLRHNRKVLAFDTVYLLAKNELMPIFY